MTLLKKSKIPRPTGPVLVLVLDGIGWGKTQDPYNAVWRAKMPRLMNLVQQERFRTVRAHGLAVGLPTDDDMGNSEVGHNALGAGRVITQGAGLVDRALADDQVRAGSTWEWLRERFSTDGTLHLIGLLSDGGVHSRLDQLQKLITLAASDGARTIRIHVLTDGRDVPDQSADRYVELLEEFLENVRSNGCDARIASGGGRMFVTMDRYESDWSIVERGWKAHVLGDARPFSSAQEAIETFRAEQSDVSDQFLPPFVVADAQGKPLGAMQNGDAVICFNYRGDRVIQISQAFESPSFSAFERGRIPDLRYAGMMEYDGDRKIPSRFLVAPPVIEMPSGALLVENGTRIFACSETHKFGHVTYFWNGNRSGAFDAQKETYVEIPSFEGRIEHAPAMRAMDIAFETAAATVSNDYDLLRVNIANGDMVGHTGNLEATVTACEVVDKAIGIMVDAVVAQGGRYIVTADHGNADDMALRGKDGAPLKDKSGRVLPRTSHTLAPVPVIVGGAIPSTVALRGSEESGLANIASTYMELLGYAPPEDWVPSLLAVEEPR